MGREFLDSLVAGSEVIVVSPMGLDQLSTVDRCTECFVWANGWKFNRKTGRRTGDRGRFGGAWLQRPLPGSRAVIIRRDLISRIKLVPQRNLDEMPEAALAEVVRLMYPGPAA